MKLIQLATLLLTSGIFAGCNYLEERRLCSQVETDLQLDLTACPDLVSFDSHGWAEESTEEALLRLGERDCAALAATPFDTAAAKTQQGYRGIVEAHSSGGNRQWSWGDWRGDTKVYVFHAGSCELSRVAHFE